LGYKNTERYFSSGGAVEKIRHESDLIATEEAESGIESSFYESVILLDDFIESMN
jgi:hypothetical protein